MSKVILISGGSGLVGKALQSRLRADGHKVRILSRRRSENPQIYYWNPSKNEIDVEALVGADVLIHLAGAGIADKKWTTSRKKLIRDSRVETAGLLSRAIESTPHNIKTVIAASAVGFYGGNRGEDVLTENSNPIPDFLSKTCVEWENASRGIANDGQSQYVFRFGVVLDKNGGALKEMAKPHKFGLGSPLGSGQQWVSWIHMDDVVAGIVQAINEDIPAGTYNLTSPNPARQEELSEGIAHALKKPHWAPKVPAFVLKTLLGEMSVVVLGSAKAIPLKLQSLGFKFKFPHLKDALKDIYER